MAMWTLLALIAFIFVLPSHLQAQEDARIDFADTARMTDARYPNQIAGEFTPGKGFDIVKTKFASLNISFYGVARYINQLPAEQSFTDHLGRVRVLDTRNDIHWHRTFIWMTGFLYSPKLRYNISVWGLASTNQVLLFGNLQYQVHKAFRPGIGIGPNLGTRSSQGPWPFFMASDRQMVDEFMRPGFTGGLWIAGEPLPRLNYTVMLGNNLSQVGIASSQLTRDLSKSVSVWWLPTTGEFGPRGGFDDFEIHEKAATRFGSSYCYMKDDRMNDVSNPTPASTQVRISDGLYLFETGALADGVTLQKATYQVLAVDAGFKYKGLAITGEAYFRKLSDFVANGVVPIREIEDKGVYVQANYPLIKKKLHIYGVGGYVWDEFDRKPWEIAGGMNFYPSGTRSWRINMHLVRVEKSPTGSYFGYYLPGQTGTIISLGTDILL